MQWMKLLAPCALLVCLAALGCGDGKKSVKVKVLMDGAPASGVSLVLFKGAAAGDGAVTGADGTAVLTALPGEYKVTASKKPVSAPMDPKEAFKKMAPKKGGMGKAIVDKSSEKAEELADDFTKQDKTPLSLTIPAAKEPVEFTVKGK